MTDLAKEMKRVRDATEVDWNDERARRVERAMQRRGRNRAIARRTGAILAAALVVVAVGAAWRHHVRGIQLAPIASHPTPPAPTAPVATVARSSITPESDDFAVESTPSGLAMHGRGTFTAAETPVVVRCGAVTVTASNATFEVAAEGDGARVSVRSGHVVVAWALDGHDAESASLDAGQTDTFPKSAAAPPKTAPPATRWRSLALAGSYDSAYVELAKAGPASVRDEPADLFLAADVARLSKHSAEAERPLERLVERYPTDARAPLAAFTLGRVRLEELGHPREAAAAFAKARALAPQGPLAEDALARQVESLSRAGDSAAAHDLALEYLRAYPSGRRTIAVKKFGGVD